MIHKIILNGYQAKTRPVLNLGTCGSYGTEQLLLRPGPEWEHLTLTATFYAPGSNEPIRILSDHR